MRLAASYSGGKDSTLAIYKALQAGNEVVCLIISTNTQKTSYVHDIEFNLLQCLANKMNIPLECVVIQSDEDYSQEFENALCVLKEKYQFGGVIFGDIDIQGHLEWGKARCDAANLIALHPLWLMKREAVIHAFLDAGFKAKIKKVNKQYLDSRIIGKDLDLELIDYFITKKVDLCGENGEYHTLVYDGPLFTSALEIKKFKISENQATYTMQELVYE